MEKELERDQVGAGGVATCGQSLAAGCWAEDLATGVELAILWPSNPEVS